MPNRVVPPNWPDHAERVSLASSPTHQRGRRPARRPAPSPSMGMPAVGYAASPAFPSPRRRCAASPAPRPRSWERTGRLPLDPASPSARPLERRLLPRLSLVKQQLIAPSSRSSHPAATMAGQMQPICWEAEQISGGRLGSSPSRQLAGR